MMSYFNKEKPKLMDLQTFVSKSLIAIMDGVHDAQVNYGKILNKDDEQSFRPLIVPSLVHGGEKNNTRIEFDIAITVTNNTIGAVNGGVSVVSLNIGGKYSSEQVNSSVSRIKFSIPVIYPDTPNNINK